MVKPPTRFAICLTMVWLLFLVILNCATLYTESAFSFAAKGQPLSTILVNEGGWPFSFVEQNYYRVPKPKIKWNVHGSALVRTVVLCGLVHVALTSLVWRKSTVTLWECVTVTTLASIVVAAAVSSESRFGGAVLHYVALYAYLSPLAIAGIRLPPQIVSAVLSVLRSVRK